MWTKPIRGTLANKLHPLTPNVGAWLFNEGSGDRIFDINGKNHGTFGVGAAAPTWVPNGLNFDTAYIDCGNDEILNITKTITISALINTNEIASTNAQIIAKYDGVSSSNDSYFLRKNTNDIQFYLRNPAGDGWNSATCYNKITVGKWAHIVGVFDGAYITVYINGQAGTPVAKTDSIRANPTEKVYIGSFNNGLNGYFDGIINHIAIYDWALTKSQISQLYYNPYCWLAQPMDLASLYTSIGQEYAENVIIELQSKYNQLSDKELKLLKELLDKYNQFETFNLEKIIKKINQSEMRKRHL